MLDADADAEPYARADAETDADADACADARADAATDARADAEADATSYYTVTSAGTDDVGIETTNAPARPKVGRAGPRAPRAVRVRMV